MIDAEDHDGDAATRALAYALWEQAGRPDGQDQVFWEAAEAARRTPHEPADEPAGGTPGVAGEGPSA